jgi:hypothetical protein
MNRIAEDIVARNAPRDCGTSLAAPRGTRRPGHVVIELEFAMTYRLEVDGPITASDGTDAQPGRQFWQMTRATLEGPALRASTPMPGIDWFTPFAAGFGRPHVRLPFRTDDGAVVLLEYRGIVHATEAFNQAVETNSGTDWADQYMRMALMFETSSAKYAWLTQRLFLARGRLLAAKSLEYAVYCVK